MVKNYMCHYLMKTVILKIVLGMQIKQHNNNAFNQFRELSRLRKKWHTICLIGMQNYIKSHVNAIIKRK